MATTPYTPRPAFRCHNLARPYFGPNLTLLLVHFIATSASTGSPTFKIFEPPSNVPIWKGTYSYVNLASCSAPSKVTCKVGRLKYVGNILEKRCLKSAGGSMV